MPRGIYKRSSVMRKKMSSLLFGNKRALGVVRSQETRNKIGIGHKDGSAWSRGKKFSIKHKNKISLALTGRKFSNKTRQRLSISHVGKNIGREHWNWRGGITPKNEKIRKSREYKLWRKSVFERDNYTCQKYGTIGGELVAHHINNFAEKEEIQLAIDNGITLSKKAHKEFHKKYSNKNNTTEQLNEFLSNDL